MLTKADKYMVETLNNILKNGYRDVDPRPKYSDGTPAHTLSVNHVMRQYDLSKGEYPICTLRPMAWKSAIKEILWIYQDESNSLEMLNNKYDVHYWNDWESKDIPNTIGIRYGATVKKHNIMKNLLEGLTKDPYSRRHIINLWQEDDFKESDGLVPCAFLTQFNVRNKNKVEYLDMVLYQRSGDSMAASGGGGINEIQYLALMMMVAKHCGYELGVFTHFVANEQIYDKHIEQAVEMINRYRECKKDRNKFLSPRPKLILSTDNTDFYKFTVDDFTMINYNPIKPQLKLPLGI